VNEEDKEFESSSLIIPWFGWSLCGGWSSNRIKDIVFMFELALIHEIMKLIEKDFYNLQDVFTEIYSMLPKFCIDYRFDIIE